MYIKEVISTKPNQVIWSKFLKRVNLERVYSYVLSYVYKGDNGKKSSKS